MKLNVIRNIFKFFSAHALIFILIFACTAQANAEHPPRYVFLFIGDGMGLPQVQLAETFLGAQSNSYRQPLLMTSFPAQGLSCTYCVNTFVTDSAAGGTALATGYKTGLGMLGVDSSNYHRYASLAETARDSGKKVGIVTTDSLVGATPASFFAHQPDRGMAYPIGVDLFASRFNLFYGAGDFADQDGRHVPLNHFDSVTNALQACIDSITPGTNQPVITWKLLPELSEQYGYARVTSPDAFTALKPGGSNIIAVVDMPQPIVAPSNAVTLADVTGKAIELLDSPNGFFIMIEASQIDKACHANDAATAAREVIALDQAVAVAYAFYTNHPDDTLIVITADHETGGMTLGHGANRFNLLAHQKETAVGFWYKLDAYRKKHTTRSFFQRLSDNLFNTDDAGKVSGEFDDLKPLLRESFGLGDESIGLDLSPSEWQQLRRAYNDSMNYKELKPDDEFIMMLYGGQDPLTVTAVRLLNEKAGVSWSTFGHSGSAVPVFAVGVGQDRFNGFMENTAVSRAIGAIAFPDKNFPPPPQRYNAIRID